MSLIVLLLLIALTLTGCLTFLAPALLLDAVVGGVSIYQRYEDRKTQQRQNEEIRALRQEIQRLRERIRQ